MDHKVHIGFSNCGAKKLIEIRHKNYKNGAVKMKASGDKIIFINNLPGNTSTAEIKFYDLHTKYTPGSSPINEFCVGFPGEILKVHKGQPVECTLRRTDNDFEYEVFVHVGLCATGPGDHH